MAVAVESPTVPIDTHCNDFTCFLLDISYFMYEYHIKFNVLVFSATHEQLWLALQWLCDRGGVRYLFFSFILLLSNHFDFGFEHIILYLPIKTESRIKSIVHCHCQFKRLTPCRAHTKYMIHSAVPFQISLFWSTLLNHPRATIIQVLFDPPAVSSAL